jgi:hypothetical protein
MTSALCDADAVSRPHSSPAALTYSTALPDDQLIYTGGPDSARYIKQDDLALQLRNTCPGWSISRSRPTSLHVHPRCPAHGEDDTVSVPWGRGPGRNRRAEEGICVDAFNIIVGIFGIFAALFAIYVFVDARRKEAVETQKAAEYQQRMADLLSIANAVAKQGTLIAGLTDRENVSKSELKHLIIAQLASVESLQSSVARTHAVEQRWQFGVPAEYRRLDASPDQAAGREAAGA